MEYGTTGAKKKVDNANRATTVMASSFLGVNVRKYGCHDKRVSVSTSISTSMEAAPRG